MEGDAPTPAATPAPSSNGVVPTVSAPLDENDIEPMSVMEMRYIRQAIDACGGNVTKAANLLEIGTSTIYRRLKEEDEQQA